MNIKYISAGIFGACMTLGVGSCEHKATINKPRNELQKYLTKEELEKANEICWSLSENDKAYSPRIAYWDSILLESKIKKAYLDGQQMVKDSLAKKEFKRPLFELPLNKKVYASGTTIRHLLMKEVSKEVDNQKFNILIKNEPELSSIYTNDNSPNKVHYFYQLLSTVKQKEAFEKGVNDERKNLITQIKE